MTSRIEEGGSSGLPDEVTAAFPILAAGFSRTPGASGLLHETHHLVTKAGAGFVLQRVSNVFSDAIHENIDAVTRHLAAHDFPTFMLERTEAGLLSYFGSDGERWRLMSRLPGVSFDRVESTAQAASAAELIGRFHAVLEHFDEPLAPMGIPFRDTVGYRAKLEHVLVSHSEHASSSRVSALRDRIEAGFAALGEPIETRERVIHGDLKISNLLFEAESSPGADRALALIDFDTLLRAPLWGEWGDAWRSWCNRRGEDESEAQFDLTLFEASLRGLARSGRAAIDEAERASLADSVERIALELATRYATDALEESYFAWDTGRFETASAHNLTRCEGQLSLAASARATRGERARLIEAILG